MENLNKRNFIGYGEMPPKIAWPNKARLAINFVINYEEGGESCILDGDHQSEHLLSDIIGATPYLGQRHLNMESLYEYGAKVGVHRLINVFKDRDLKTTVFCVGLALEKNPTIGEKFKSANFEISSHGYRWLDYQNVNEEIEREHIHKTIEVHQKYLGEKPPGFYQGKPSLQTRKLIIESNSFLYDSDSYSDELPYWLEGNLSKPHLIIPYTLECNDMKFATSNGFSHGDQFFMYLKDTFDCLYEEGITAPKMMSVGLHCRLIGRPGRIQSLKKFLDYIANFDEIWVGTREEIAKIWHQNYRPN